MDYSCFFIFILMRIATGSFLHNFRFPSLQPLRPSTTQATVPVLMSSAEQECISGPSVYYSGHRNVTDNGIPCQRWDVIVPHEPMHHPQDGGHHNYCRNPDRDVKGTWCYTVDPNLRWRYCGIPKCVDHNSRVIWTNYDQDKGSSHIVSANADPEHVSRQLTAGVYINGYRVLANKSSSEIYALVSDVKNNRLIFADRRSQTIGFQDLSTNLTTRAFEGIAFWVENLAYDWVTGNLYWADTSFNWIMVGDPTTRFYKPLYRNESYYVHSVAVHSTQRKLFFSQVHQITNHAKLCLADLAGKNVSVLLRSPQIRDVLGITVDYTDDRLYFTEYTGVAAIVSSCRFDGSNKISHATKRGAQFWNVAAYLDFLYMTDVIETGHHYTIRVVSKEGKKELQRYTMKGLPRGITVMSIDEETNFEPEFTVGGCNDTSLPKCEQICLPRLGSHRECACSIGYRLHNGHQCRTDTIEYDTLLAVDEGQGKVFQLPFNRIDNDELGSETRASIVEVSTPARVSSATIRRDGAIYWSDQLNNSIGISYSQHNQHEFRYQSVRGTNFVADQCNNNVFFLDPTAQSIRVMNAGYVKTLITLDELNHNVQMLAHDIKNQKLYWTDTRHAEGMGQVWRMNTDGSGVELVFSQLNWPRGIVVDHRRGSLFISEARTGMIYEQPLAHLQLIRSTSPQNISRQFDVAAHVRRHSIFINDIKVYKDRLFFYDDTDHFVETFHLNSGPASMERFGPKEFVLISTLAVYSRDNRGLGIDCSWSPCSQSNPCDHVCVDVGPTNNRKPVCLCDDNAGAVTSSNCSGSKPSANKPPSYGKTCPGNLVFPLSSCAVESRGLWVPPTWVDDHTPSDRLKTTTDVSEKFERGTYPIVYTATDQHGASSECAFYVTFQGTECGEPPTLPPHVVSLEFSCGRQVGSVLTVACKYANKMSDESKRNKTYEVKCVERGLWIPQGNLSELCSEPVSKVHSNKMTSLGVGGIIGICIIAILLVFGFVFAALMSQRKGSIWLVKINFPKIWMRRTDTVQISMTNGLHETDGPNGVDCPEIITTIQRDM